jgi:hypothetical protein
MDTPDNVLHRLRVKLYANNLPRAGGPYIPRPDREAPLTLDDLCVKLIQRGGYTGSPEDLRAHARQLFAELVYDLADGFAVDTGFFTLAFQVGGTFEGPDAPPDPRRNPVSCAFRPKTRLRRIMEAIQVTVEGLAQTDARIDRVTDFATGAVNELLTPGGTVILTGSRLRVQGAHPDCGLYFLPQPSPQSAPGGLPAPRVKASSLIENRPATLIAAIPPLPDAPVKLEVVTQYTRSSTLLKIPQTITFPQVFTVSPPETV